MQRSDLLSHFVHSRGDGLSSPCRHCRHCRHTILRGAFYLTNGIHSSLVFPVSSSCIMPCFKARVLSRFCSKAAISASMSERTVAMACCSDLVDGKAMLIFLNI